MEQREVLRTLTREVLGTIAMLVESVGTAPDDKAALRTIRVLNELLTTLHRMQQTR